MIMLNHFHLQLSSVRNERNGNYFQIRHICSPRLFINKDLSLVGEPTDKLVFQMEDALSVFKGAETKFWLKALRSTLTVLGAAESALLCSKWYINSAIKILLETELRYFTSSSKQPSHSHRLTREFLSLVERTTWDSLFVFVKLPVLNLVLSRRCFYQLNFFKSLKCCFGHYNVSFRAPIWLELKQQMLTINKTWYKY